MIAFLTTMAILLVWGALATGLNLYIGLYPRKKIKTAADDVAELVIGLALAIWAFYLLFLIF